MGVGCLGETRETAVLVNYGPEHFRVSGVVFNGDADKQGAEDLVRDWGVSVSAGF